MAKALKITTSEARFQPGCVHLKVGHHQRRRMRTNKSPEGHPQTPGNRFGDAFESHEPDLRPPGKLRVSRNPKWSIKAALGAPSLGASVGF